MCETYIEQPLGKVFIGNILIILFARRCIHLLLFHSATKVFAKL